MKYGCVAAACFVAFASASANAAPRCSDANIVGTVKDLMRSSIQKKANPFAHGGGPINPLTHQPISMGADVDALNLGSDQIMTKVIINVTSIRTGAITDNTLECKAVITADTSAIPIDTIAGRTNSLLISQSAQILGSGNSFYYSVEVTDDGESYVTLNPSR